jgi:alpha-D-ribose 1-methylphosphonate 5-triphosphate diphosphatase
MTTCWSAGRVVLADRVLSPGTVVVYDGMIIDGRPGATPGADDLGADAIIVPGAIDLHSDAVEKLAEPRPGVRLPFPVAVRALDHRLAGAGITTGYAALSLAGDEIGLRERSATEMLAYELRILSDPKVDHRLHLRVEVTDEDSVVAAEELLGYGAVAMLSAMNHTPGQGQFPSTDSYVAFYRRNYAVSERELHARIGVKLAAAPHVEIRLTRLGTATARAGTPFAWHDPDSARTIERARSHGAVIAKFPTTAAAARAARPAGLAVAMGAPNRPASSAPAAMASALPSSAAGTYRPGCRSSNWSGPPKYEHGTPVTRRTPRWSSWAQNASALIMAGTCPSGRCLCPERRPGRLRRQSSLCWFPQTSDHCLTDRPDSS